MSFCNLIDLSFKMVMILTSYLTVSCATYCMLRTWYFSYLDILFREIEVINSVKISFSCVKDIYWSSIAVVTLTNCVCPIVLSVALLLVTANSLSFRRTCLLVPRACQEKFGRMTS